ncbi:hypothetical protein MSIMFB_02095 [Mycobacterium simulans]|uniref:Uncharacterized protein n=1 Tax=Mycobacterium simulans TaxID=627089 RepID=A0A7Z7IJA3_9MYCO|nr:hypothetical protein [Mycobacterium simulans]SOJ54606.1 hypothetical protein MSIMFB_02095 [Mycobacterium simulans]
MSGPGWRILIGDVDGKLRALCKIQTLADGGYSVLCPYHSAREGWLFKLPLGLGHRPAAPTLVSVEYAVHYSASDRVKLSHHRDGLVQFSSEVKGRIKSGINPLTGQPRGIGVFSGPIDHGVPSGPAFGVTAWGMNSYMEIETPRQTDRIFRHEDLYHYLCTPASSNSYALEGWLFAAEMWHGVRGSADDMRIHVGGMKFGDHVLATREFRVIPLVNTESFLGLQVSRTKTSFPSPSGFLFGGPRELSKEGNQIIATYPAPDKLFANAESLDYTPNGE